MAQGKYMDDNDDDERLKKLMKAATGCDNVDEVRNKTPIARDSKPIESAKEFLEDMEDDEDIDVNQNAGEKPRIIAPSPMDDEILKSVSLVGPAPQPPAPRTLPQPLTSSSRSLPEEVEQSSNVMGTSTSRQQESASSDNKEPNPMTTLRPMTTKAKDNDLNYKWISVIYVIGSLFSLAFYLLEEYGARPQRSIVASLNDLYIVFLPYIPCLIWTLLRLNQRQNASVPMVDVAKKEQ